MAGYQIRLPRLPLPCCSHLLSPSPSVFFLSTVRCSAVSSPSLSTYLPFAITGVAVIVKKNIETSTTAASRPPAAPIVSASSATSSFSASSSAAASASRVADVSPASLSSLLLPSPSPSFIRNFFFVACPYFFQLLRFS